MANPQRTKGSGDHLLSSIIYQIENDMSMNTLWRLSSRGCTRGRKGSIVKLKGLPVTLVPEQLRVAPMRNDVIHKRRLCVSSLPQALLTQRMDVQECFTGFTPSAAVATAACRPRMLRVHSLMLLAVHLARLHQLATSWMAARYLWLPWHGFSPSHVECPRGFVPGRALSLSIFVSLILS